MSKEAPAPTVEPPTRPSIIGPDSGPEAPFPLQMEGEVISGFGRGSKELGIPTANIPVEGVKWIEDKESGVYFGWAGIRFPDSHAHLSDKPPASSPSSTTTTTSSSTSKEDKNWRIYPMVMSIGYNPFYKNKTRSAEVHIMHKFTEDFYGAWMRVSLMGFIRKELDYKDLESLVKDINMDIEVAKRSLQREKWGVGKEGDGRKGDEEWLGGKGWVLPEKKAEKKVEEKEKEKEKDKKAEMED